MIDVAVAGRHRAWVEIDHAALSRNLAALRRLAGPTQQIIAVVKANAYGHGAVAVSETLVAQRVERLAVATLDEAAELRAGGQRGPIVLLWGIGAEDASRVAELDLEPIVDSAAAATWLDEAAASGDRRIAVHLKIDTGLGRQGIEPGRALELATRVAASPRLRLAGTMTHLAAVGEDEAFTDVQLQRMAGVLDGLRSRGIDPGVVHVAATGALLAGIGAFADAARPGLGLYGMAPAWADGRAVGVQPILTLKALPLRIFEVGAGTAIGYGLRWTAARTSRLATLPIGYGDGWPRSHLNNGAALVRGHRAPMVGAISMDGLVVDITDAGEVTMDDEFVLIGRQESDEITADEVADQRRTINYEVTTALRRRLARRHVRP